MNIGQLIGELQMQNAAAAETDSPHALRLEGKRRPRYRARPRAEGDKLSQNMQDIVDFVSSRTEPQTADAIARATKIERHCVAVYALRLCDSDHLTRLGVRRHYRYAIKG